jgi:hypothetical protein
MMWETGLSQVIDHSALWCSYDNETCYYAKNVPVIFSVDKSEGYHTGGQNLTITGHGFASGEISVTVDGVECVITQNQETSLSCEVQEKGSASVTGTATVGSQGIKWRFIDNDDGNRPDVSDLDQYTAVFEQTLTQFETPY